MLFGSNRNLEFEVGLRAALNGVLGVVGVGVVGSGDKSSDTSSIGGSEKKEKR